MLQITIPAGEYFDDSTQEFINYKEVTLRLEHSLVSISKWEAKWKKVFLSKEEKTLEETIDYIRCMTITQGVDESAYGRITDANIKQVENYISDPMTATYIRKDKIAGSSRETVTSELIYYWMIALGIPVEFQKWHLNRLLTLIEVCNVKNTPPKKRNPREIAKHNAAINAARRKRLGSKG